MSAEKLKKLQAEIDRLRAVIAKIMAEAGVPEKNYDDDMVTQFDADGSWEVVPFRVAVLCNQYGLSWECFLCNDHDKWIDEVGSSFPHHWDGMTCPDCRGDDDE